MKPLSLPQQALAMAREHGISIDEALFVLACDDAIRNPEPPVLQSRLVEPRKPAHRMTGVERHG
jgi:hypothetical protein